MSGGVYEIRMPRGPLGKVIAVVGGLVFLVLGVFMFAFVAIAALVFAALGLFRIWWTGRGRPQRDRPDVLTVEYTVETPQPDHHDAMLPPSGNSN